MTVHDFPDEQPGPVLAKLRKPRSQQLTRLAFVADIHLSTDGFGTSKVYHRTEELFETLISDINARDVSGVVFLGDQTHDGRPKEFDLFDTMVEQLQFPWISLPGNHDVPKEHDEHRSLLYTEFKRRYTPRGDGYPFVTEFNETSVISLNSSCTPDGCLRNTASGKISQQQLDYISGLDLDVSRTIVTLHHNLSLLPEHTVDYPWNQFQIENRTSLVDSLPANSSPLVVSGHHHLPAVTNTENYLELIAPAVCSFPQSYLLAEISSRGTTVFLVPLSDRDEITESYWFAKNGSVTSQGSLEMASNRLGRLPLLVEE
ncbi:hypothetical protein EA462_16480 [Natrarchaeobius halalkaliphilus]|uniref:Calcineurin-like phosphoesterase domain-containing protein n=1 Tax=Natrarchaeobius halalkaliphilus TaxID=1679091 RepID=A0A3N6LXF9_9EURY|nr:metallophosphoesterase [Natrarchaeobius halalkaliphilus]RQG86731.1 hypothetical protein EA462_16480 [Natrarchaeobius halalkaliphilus]